MYTKEVWTILVANLMVLVPGLALGLIGYLHFAKRFDRSHNVYQRSAKYLVVFLVFVVSVITIWFGWDIKRRTALQQQELKSAMQFSQQ